MRLSPVIHIAHRDIRCELAAKQRGWILIAVTTLLLLPLATVPESVWEPTESDFVITGAVPESAKNISGIVVVDGPAHMGLVVEEDGLLAVGSPPPLRLRQALDAGGPGLEWVNVSPQRKWPKRSILFALVSASVLTGALSESISGERSQKTLQALLTAAITRFELIAGKCLAWAGFGAVSALLAALVSLICQTSSPGWWLLPLPFVPATTVALGLYMLRHATDRIAGATISLRLLPAVLSVLAVTAWFLGGIHPLIGASVPLGGALIATGQVWTGPMPALVSATSASLTGCLLLWRTASQLEHTPQAAPMQRGVRAWVREAGLGAILWWMPVCGALVWANAGNHKLANSLGPETAIFAATAMVALCAWVSHAQVRAPRRHTQPPPSPQTWMALAAGLVGLLWLQMGVASPTLTDPLWSEAQHRLGLALQPTAWSLLLIPLQEWYFRGHLVRRVGPVGATGLFVLIASPLDPVHGLLLGSLLVYANHRLPYGFFPSISLRLILTVGAQLCFVLLP